MLKIFSILLCLLVTQSVLADKNPCLKGKIEDQVTCIQEEFKASETELNEVFQDIIERLKAKQEYGEEKNFIFENMMSRLRIAERSWIYFRAGECELVSFSKINRESVVASNIACFAEMNRKRTKDLKEFFSGYLKTPL